MTIGCFIREITRRKNNVTLLIHPFLMLFVFQLGDDFDDDQDDNFVNNSRNRDDEDYAVM